MRPALDHPTGGHHWQRALPPLAGKGSEEYSMDPKPSLP